LKAEEEAEEYNKKAHITGAVLAQGMTPTDNYIHHPNPSINLNEMWEGVSLVQLADHENDEDDIVPELNEAVKAPMKLVQTGEEQKNDFAGDKYKEVYDEWSNSSITLRKFIIWPDQYTKYII